MDNLKANAMLLRALKSVERALVKNKSRLGWNHLMGELDDETHRYCIECINNDLVEIRAKKQALTIINQQPQISTDEKDSVCQIV